MFITLTELESTQISVRIFHIAAIRDYGSYRDIILSTGDTISVVESMDTILRTIDEANT